MSEKIRLLFLSANPWTTSRILVDEEARNIFLSLESSPECNSFDFVKYPAVRFEDIKQLLLKHRPHIVHFTGHGSKKGKMILQGASGRGKGVTNRELVELFRCFNNHVRVVVLNMCFSKKQAMALTQVIDYTIGINGVHGDRAAVHFSAIFYSALATNRSVRQAFDLAIAELKLRKIRRSKGFELFIRRGIDVTEPFLPQHSYVFKNIFINYNHAQNYVDRFANGNNGSSSSVTYSFKR